MPNKVGLDFFPFDVDFFEDEKIQYVSSRFGIKGEVCAIRLLARIYRNGYFIKWDADATRLFAKVAGKEFSPGLVNAVVHELLKRGFFDQSLFESFGILTSHGIQKRYFKACARRLEVPAEKDYLLVNPRDFKNLRMTEACSSASTFPKCRHNVDISPQNVDISASNVDIGPQSKGKESKEYCYTDHTVKQETVISEAVQSACMALTGGIGPVQYAQLAELVRLHGEARVLEALRITRMRGQRRLAYAAGILRNWKRDGYDGTHEGGGHSGGNPEERNGGNGRLDKYRNIKGL